MHCLNVKLKDNIHGQFIKIRLFIEFMFKLYGCVSWIN